MSKDSAYIKSIRKMYGLTQVELAKKLGVSFATVNRWENKQHSISSLARAHIELLLRRKNESDTPSRSPGTEL
jgi:transcriptional regulator with XRE-family HTH domain